MSKELRSKLLYSILGVGGCALLQKTGKADIGVIPSMCFNIFSEDISKYLTNDEMNKLGNVVSIAIATGLSLLKGSRGLSVVLEVVVSKMLYEISKMLSKKGFGDGLSLVYITQMLIANIPYFLGMSITDVILLAPLLLLVHMYNRVEINLAVNKNHKLPMRANTTSYQFCFGGVTDWNKHPILYTLFTGISYIVLSKNNVDGDNLQNHLKTTYMNIDNIRSGNDTKKVINKTFNKVLTVGLILSVVIVLYPIVLLKNTNVFSIGLSIPYIILEGYKIYREYKSHTLKYPNIIGGV